MSDVDEDIVVIPEQSVILDTVTFVLPLHESFFPGTSRRRFQWIVLMLAIFFWGFIFGTFGMYYKGYIKGYMARRSVEMPVLEKILRDGGEARPLFCKDWGDITTCSLSEEFPAPSASVLSRR